MYVRGNVIILTSFEMRAPACLARLTSWETTKCKIGSSNTTASMLKLCKGVPGEDENLCEECKERPIGGKYQTKMFHGLLTEEIPYESHIYGSPWYWEKVAKFGDPEDEEWLEEAQRRQEEIENVLDDAWKVQRPSEEDLEEMVEEVKTKQKKQAVNRLRGIKKQEEKPLSKAGTILKTFIPIKNKYEESNKPPKKLQTDSIDIRKEQIGEQWVWITETELVFDVESNGDIGQLLGKMVDGEFVEDEI